MVHYCLHLHPMTGFPIIQYSCVPWWWWLIFKFSGNYVRYKAKPGLYCTMFELYFTCWFYVTHNIIRTFLAWWTVQAQYWCMGMGVGLGPESLPPTCQCHGSIIRTWWLCFTYKIWECQYLNYLYTCHHIVFLAIAMKLISDFNRFGLLFTFLKSEAIFVT